LAIYNNEFILDSAHVGSEMINWKVTNMIGNYCISKSHTCHITSSLLSMCSKCLPLAQMPATNIDTTRKQQAQHPAFHKIFCLFRVWGLLEMCKNQVISVMINVEYFIVHNISSGCIL